MHKRVQVKAKDLDDEEVLEERASDQEFGENLKTDAVQELEAFRPKPPKPQETQLTPLQACWGKMRSNLERFMRNGR